MTRRLNAEKGLTLIEIMVVLIILGIVISFVGGRVLGAGDKAKARITKLKLQDVAQKIDQYRMEYNALPQSLTDLTQCNDQTGPGCIPSTTEDQLVDAWGNKLDYRLENNGRTYVIISMGGDGKTGGEGADYDLNHSGP
jgi:general secretion pathway protein G